MLDLETGGCWLLAAWCNDLLRKYVLLATKDSKAHKPWADKDTPCGPNLNQILLMTPPRPLSLLTKIVQHILPKLRQPQQLRDTRTARSCQQEIEGTF